MRTYPHGLDADILEDDLQVERDSIADLEKDAPQAQAEGEAGLLRGLGEQYRNAACYSYALGESPGKLRDDLYKALKYWVTAVNMGVVIDPFEFITVLSLAVIVGKPETGKGLGELERARYTNEDVEADEVVYGVAAIMSAYARQDDAAIKKTMSAYNPETINTKKIYRYDRMIFFPLLPVYAALYKGDAKEFSAALQKREAEFIKFFSKSDELNDPEALIDLPGLAAMAFAARRGIRADTGSVYRPVELLGKK